MLKRFVLLRRRERASAAFDPLQCAAWQMRTLPFPEQVTRYVHHELRPLSAVMGEPAPYDVVLELCLRADLPLHEDVTGRLQSWRQPEWADGIAWDRSCTLLADVRSVRQDRGPGVTFLAFLHRHEGASLASFLQHYHYRHAPLLATVPAFWDQVRLYEQHDCLPGSTIRWMADETDCAIGFDAVSKLRFADMDCAVECFRHPDYLATIKPDELLMRRASMRFVSIETDIRSL